MNTTKIRVVIRKRDTRTKIYLPAESAKLMGRQGHDPRDGGLGGEDFPPAADDAMKHPDCSSTVELSTQRPRPIAPIVTEDQP